MNSVHEWKIPKKSYLEGLRLSQKNAERLFSKANELFNKKQILAAFLIGLAAYEEVGKALLILKYWDDESISKNQWDKWFKDHKKKLITATERMVIAFKKLHAEIDGIEVSACELDKKDTDMIHNLIIMRTGCLYVDYNNDSQRFIEPELDEKTLFEYAKIVILTCTDYRNTLNQEISNKNIVLE